MNLSIPVSPILGHSTEPQETPILPIISARLETLIIQFHALVKVMRTKKFRELSVSNPPAWAERVELYQDAQEELIDQIDKLGGAHGGTIHIWEGAV
jgi:hypothetical protein